MLRNLILATALVAGPASAAVVDLTFSGSIERFDGFIYSLVATIQYDPSLAGTLPIDLPFAITDFGGLSYTGYHSLDSDATAAPGYTAQFQGSAFCFKSFFKTNDQPLQGLNVGWVMIGFDGFNPASGPPSAQSFLGKRGGLIVYPGNDSPLTFYGQITSVTSSTISAVPEPSTWALLIGGIGCVGGLMRRKRLLHAA